MQRNQLFLFISILTLSLLILLASLGSEGEHNERAGGEQNQMAAETMSNTHGDTHCDWGQIGPFRPTVQLSNVAQRHSHLCGHNTFWIGCQNHRLSSVEMGFGLKPGGRPHPAQRCYSPEVVW